MFSWMVGEAPRGLGRWLSAHELELGTPTTLSSLLPGATTARGTTNVSHSILNWYTTCYFLLIHL